MKLMCDATRPQKLTKAEVCEEGVSRCDKWLASSKTFKHYDGDVEIFDFTGANPKRVSLAMLCLANEVEDKFVRSS